MLAPVKKLDSPRAKYGRRNVLGRRIFNESLEEESDPFSIYCNGVCIQIGIPTLAASLESSHIRCLSTTTKDKMLHHSSGASGLLEFSR